MSAPTVKEVTALVLRIQDAKERKRKAADEEKALTEQLEDLIGIGGEPDPAANGPGIGIPPTFTPVTVPPQPPAKKRLMPIEDQTGEAKP